MSFINSKIMKINKYVIEGITALLFNKNKRNQKNGKKVYDIEIIDDQYFDIETWFIKQNLIGIALLEGFNHPSFLIRIKGIKK